MIPYSLPSKLNDEVFTVTLHVSTAKTYGKAYHESTVDSLVMNV